MLTFYRVFPRPCVRATTRFRIKPMFFSTLRDRLPFFEGCPPLSSPPFLPDTSERGTKIPRGCRETTPHSWIPLPTTGFEGRGRERERRKETKRERERTSTLVNEARRRPDVPRDVHGNFRIISSSPVFSLAAMPIPLVHSPRSIDDHDWPR